MVCVSTVSYRVKLNGELSEWIVPSRGLRQGDPLSPYLFLLCQEWFSVRLTELQRSKKVEGVKLAQGMQRLNHLLFADDCMVFIMAELRQLAELHKLLACFERLAGQRVNQEKFEFFCSPNMEDTMRMVLANFLGMRVVRSHFKYLGLPAIISQNKTQTFKEIEENLCKRAQDWKNHSLSWIGRESLIKACFQSQLIYAMSCFKLPRTMCDRLDKLMMRFWWSGGKTKRSIHWVKKEALLKEKPMGLGF